MSVEDEHSPLEANDTSPAEAGPEQSMLELPTACSEEAKTATQDGIDVPETDKVTKQQPQRNEMPPASADHAPEPVESIPFEVTKSERPQKPKKFFQERPPRAIEVAPQVLRHWTRRDVLLFGAGAIAALVGGGSLLPQTTLERLGIIHGNQNWPKKEWLLNRALRIDDDVAEALYSRNRLVPTYTKSQITPLKNNYNGATPGPSYIPEWRLTLDGLSSGLSVSLDIRTLLSGYQIHEQITRLVCVEGWSAVAGWSGLKFDDLLRAYPPVSQAKWARIESSVNLGPWGNPDPYFVSLDLPTARHPQTLLATHLNGKPLTVEHGAPLRLLVPVKLGLKNIKAITRITYTTDEPPDYWAKRGYSRYDGI